jgi:hypothetical protein
MIELFRYLKKQGDLGKRAERQKILIGQKKK